MIEMNKPTMTEQGEPPTITGDTTARLSLIRAQLVEQVQSVDSELARHHSVRPHPWPLRAIVTLLNFFYSSPNPQTATYFDRDPVARGNPATPPSPLFDDTKPLSLGR